MFLFFLILIFPARALESPDWYDPSATFTFQDFQALLEEHRPSSVDEAVHLFPDSFKRNVTFVHLKSSSQEASWSFPRVILWSDRGGFALTYDQKDFHSFQFVASEQRLRFYKTTLSAGSSPKSEESPRCLVCHGTDPRPIWKEYPIWEGVYGSFHDFAKDPVEANALRSFLDSVFSFPRYLALFEGNPESVENSVYPYRERISLNPLNLETAMKHRPNLRLGAFLSRLSSHRSARMIESRFPDARERASWIRKLANCEGEGESLKFLEDAGLVVSDFDLRFEYEDPANDDLDFRLSYFDGSASVLEYTVAQLIQGLAREDARFENLLPRLRGLRQKYVADLPRNILDRPLFDELDHSSKWFPLPYVVSPLTVNIQKREPYGPPYKAGFKRLCELLLLQ